MNLINSADSKGIAENTKANPRYLTGRYVSCKAFDKNGLYITNKLTPKTTILEIINAQFILSF